LYVDVVFFFVQTTTRNTRDAALNDYNIDGGAYGGYPQAQVPIPKQTQGPPGANLFIMQIPKLWRDESLRAAFAPFGNILSTRVFIDKV
jgi:hypothetical protein